jgi:hypothetical protein
MESEKSVEMLCKHKGVGMMNTFTARGGEHGESLWMVTSFTSDSAYFL